MQLKAKRSRLLNGTGARGTNPEWRRILSHDDSVALWSAKQGECEDPGTQNGGGKGSRGQPWHRFLVQPNDESARVSPPAWHPRAGPAAAGTIWGTADQALCGFGAKRIGVLIVRHPYFLAYGWAIIAKLADLRRVS